MNSPTTSAAGTATLRRPAPEPGIAGRLAEWESAGLLSHEQVESITSFEAARPVPATRRFGRLVTVISVLGALLVGAGVMLSVASNWEAIPDYLKLAVLVAAVIALEAGGWRLRETGRSPRVGGALVLAGYLLYGAGIHLIAQTYHRPLDDPLLLLLWAVPGLPLAHLMRSPAMVVAGLGVAGAALGIRTAGWFEDVGDPGMAVFAVFMATAAAVLTAGVVLERTRSTAVALGGAYRFVGAATGLVLLYVGGFRWFYDDRSFSDVLPAPAGLWMGLMASLALGGLVLLILQVAAGQRIAARVDGVAVVVALGFAAWWATGAAGPSLLAAGIVNLALLAAIAWLVTLGLLERREALVNVAVAVFALALFTRYVEIGMGMMGTGFSFIGTGLVLLGVGYGLERTRRALLARLEEVGDEG